MSDAVTVKLAKPVTHNETSYSELTFREPTVGDLILGDRETTQLAKMTTILASISETPLPAFKKISAKDFKAIVAATSALMGNDKTDTTGD